MGTSGDLNDWGCLEIQGTVVTNCRNEDIPADGHVKIPEGVTEIAGGSGNSTDMAGFIDGLNDAFKQFGPLFFGSGAFRSCSSLKSVSIPASVTKIGDGAFYQCTSLASVTIPEGVTEIGKLAFYGCTSLVSVVIPESMRSIGDEAFKGCPKLAVYFCSSVTAVDNSEWGGERMDSVFGSATENGCCNWRGPAPIPSEFTGRTDITTVTIPDGRKTIEGREFDGCTNLASVTIPEGVTEIRDSAFRSCTSLASVSIPASVTLISNHAFYGCTSLASMTIPEGVTEIGKLAFKNCTGLASVVIPRSVRRIGDEAFCGCKGLSIHYTGNEADWGKVSIGDGAFDGAKIIYNLSGNPFSDLFGNSFNSFDDLFQRLGIWGAQQSGGAGAGKQTATANTKMKCPSCETEWTLGKSANRPTACPFCGASLS